MEQHTQHTVIDICIGTILSIVSTISLKDIFLTCLMAGLGTTASIITRELYFYFKHKWFKKK